MSEEGGAAAVSLASGDVAGDRYGGFRYRGIHRESDMFARQVEVLFQQTPVSLLATFVTAVVLCVILWEHTPRQVLCLWAACAGVVVLARTYLLSAYRRKSRIGNVAPAFWLMCSRIGATAAGIVWGVGAVILPPSGHVFLEVLVLLFNGGLMAGATSAYAFDLVSYGLFVGPMATSMAGHYLLQSDGFGQVTGTMILVFTGLMSLYAIRLQRILVQTLQLEFANDALLERLDAEHRSLEERVAERTFVLERINKQLTSEITKSRELALKLTYQATHDALTQLINRAEFEHRLDRVLKSAIVEQSEHVLCYFDLDQFKIVNDSCGHFAGDELLRRIAQLVKERIRSRDTLARLGGDEFGILMEHCSLQQARGTVKALYDFLRGFRFTWEDKTFAVGLSMGIMPINAQSGDVTSVLKQVDAACYEAKDRGRNRLHIIEDPQDAAISRRHGKMQLVTRIEHALANNRFQLYYQTIVPIGGTVEPAPGLHYEALLRLDDDNLGLIGPALFMPTAERYQLASKLDKWVVERMFAWLASDRRRQNALYQCAINLSGQSLGEPKFQDFVIDAIRRWKIPADKICFEITETAAIGNLQFAMQLIDALRGLGCRFALDDFGTGLSSFSYLRSLPVDYLKIDGCFVQDIADDSVAYAMVRSINEIGHLLGKKTVAEYVVSERVRKKLAGIGVDYGQGYGISEPRPIDLAVA